MAKQLEIRWRSTIGWLYRSTRNGVEFSRDGGKTWKVPGGGTISSSTVNIAVQGLAGLAADLALALESIVQTPDGPKFRIKNTQETWQRLSRALNGEEELRTEVERG